ncbi:DUF6929 family protein [Hymenobacter sp. B81]|uniref:DUF6929 family protein n=1 Tax=Hymenobacter sp. B81 TaxID=3344878 RepID=UPI0037DD2580
MNAAIVRQLPLPGLPSASGIEAIGEVAYVIGDDSPLLYCLNAATFQPGQPVTLFETAHFSSGRIPKDLKPDLECLTAVTTADGEYGLLALGSGATPARETGFWVNLARAQPGAAGVFPLSLSALYQSMRRQLPAGLVLNLEAAATTADELFLLQRSVGTDLGNLLYRCPLEPALALLRHRSNQVPAFQVQRYQLPAINGKPAGFSGASGFQNKLFVTASVEDTVDAVADGAVLGSFVGWLDPQDRRDLTTAHLTRLELPGGQPYLGKVESVTVRRQLGPGRYELLLVTDDDAGGSTALVVELSL